LLKTEMRVVTLEAGDGMSLFARLWLAVVESRRPSGTAQAGPPSCTRGQGSC